MPSLFSIAAVSISRRASGGSPVPAILGFGAAFGLWGYVRLGASASQGGGASLEVSGPYRYSRNPQYVGAIGVLLGFALLCASELGLLAGAAVSIWFVTAPFAEEPWLRRHLGARYGEYLEAAPRFLGFPRRGRGSRPNKPLQAAGPVLGSRPPSGRW